MFSKCPATRFTFFAVITTLPLTLMNKANANHWLLGDENAVHCYSADPSQPDTAEQRDMVIKGVNMRWTVPIPGSAQLAAGKPIESAITVSLSPEFFQDNNGTDLGSIGVGSKGFQDLCYKKIAPNGFVDIPIYFENLVLPADTWTIISHIKIMHIQCAIGVLRTIRNADAASTAQTNNDPRPLATWQVALMISGCILAVLLFSGIAFLVYRKRKANRSGNGSDQHINNPNNDPNTSFTNIQRQSSNPLRFSQTYVSPPVSPSRSQHQDVQRYSMMSNPYQPMIYVPCEQYPPPQGYATYLSPTAPLNGTPMASPDPNMVPMCYTDPNTGRYVTFNQNHPYQQPSQPSQYPLRVVGDPNRNGQDGNLPVYSDDSRQHPMDYSFAASSTGKSDRS